MMTMDYTFERRLEFQREEVIEERRKELIRKKLLKRKSLEQIAEELEEDPEELRLLYEQVQEELAVK